MIDCGCVGVVWVCVGVGVGWVWVWVWLVVGMATAKSIASAAAPMALRQLRLAAVPRLLLAVCIHALHSCVMQSQGSVKSERLLGDYLYYGLTGSPDYAGAAQRYLVASDHKDAQARRYAPHPHTSRSSPHSKPAHT